MELSQVKPCPPISHEADNPFQGRYFHGTVVDHAAARLEQELAKIPVVPGK
jgi:hypothetical protein